MPMHGQPVSRSYRDINESPEFVVLKRARRRATWCFASLIVLAFVVFYGAAAFYPGLLARTVPAGGHISIGIYFAITVTVLSIVFAALYSWWANTRLDRKTNAVRARFSIGDD